jgi:hypothetical protein
MNKRIKMASLLALALGFLLMGSIAQAQVPQLLNYQGVLKDGSGTPITGTVSIDFTIYDAPTGGTALWTETQSNVSVNNGLFNVLLGSDTPLPAGLFYGTYAPATSGDRYLGVKVGADPEMSPRQQLVSVSDALKAGDADTLGDGTVDFDATKSTTQIHNGTVDIEGPIVTNKITFDLTGTDTPDIGRTVLRTVGGNTELLLTGYDASAGQFYELFHGDIVNHKLYLGSNTMYMDGNHNVGIGNSNPHARLEVTGPVLATAFNVNSSRALKKDITPLGQKDYTTILNELDNLQMVRYLYKTEYNRPPHLGVIAEDSPQDILDPSGKRVSVSDYTGFVMAGLKAQMQQIKALTEKVNKLEAELAAKQAVTAGEGAVKTSLPVKNGESYNVY